MKDSIIVIDDEQDFLDSIRRGLVSAGFSNIALFSKPGDAVAAIREGKVFAVALIDITMPEINGVELLEIIKNTSPDTECLMVSAVDEARVAVDCLKKGAYDYLTKPISKDDLVSAVKRAQERRRLLEVVAVGKAPNRPEILNKDAFQPIVTRSDKMLRLLKEAELHAASDVPILITGESGTGKELLARGIHHSSTRADYPFTSINMASLVGTLFDSEFFGHTKGAFTGADRDHRGFLENTDHGTLFLDEIGDLPLDFQGKLLRVLQDGEFIKIGTGVASRVDIRIIAATNVDLDRLIAKQIFRKDLYYRLKGAWLHIPPLRERKEDIPLLAQTFLDERRYVYGRPQIDADALIELVSYDFPGNVRELRSIMQAAVNLSQGRTISTRYLPPYVLKSVPAGKGQKADRSREQTVMALADIEKAHILEAYEKTGRNKVQTAALLGIGLNTLRRKLASFGME